MNNTITHIASKTILGACILASIVSVHAQNNSTSSQATSSIPMFAQCLKQAEGSKPEMRKEANAVFEARMKEIRQTRKAALTRATSTATSTKERRKEIDAQRMRAEREFASSTRTLVEDYEMKRNGIEKEAKKSIALCNALKKEMKPEKQEVRKSERQDERQGGRQEVRKDRMENRASGTPGMMSKHR